MRRMKHVFMLLLALGILAYAGAQPAQADVIMMTGDGWTFSSDTNAYKDFTVGGVTLRVNIASYVSGTHSLSYDTTAGFGVNSASGSLPLLDSSDIGGETLIVTFNRDVTVSGYGMSDWSTGSGLYPRFYKYGGVEISLPTTGGSHDTNGFMSFSFAGTTLLVNESVRFHSMIGSPHDALGLARLDVTVDGAPVPIPGALWLLGSGLIGLVSLRRRMKK